VELRDGQGERRGGGIFAGRVRVTAQILYRSKSLVGSARLPHGCPSRNSMLCENMQGREEEILRMDEIFLATNVKIGEWATQIVSSIFGAEGKKVRKSSTKYVKISKIREIWRVLEVRKDSIFFE